MTYTIRISQNEPDESGTLRTIETVVNEDQAERIIEICKENN